MSSNPLDRTLHCSLCNKTFKSPKTFQDHQRSKGHVRRSGVGTTQQYPCRYCGDVFTRQSSRKRHQENVHWIVDEIDRPPAGNGLGRHHIDQTGTHPTTQLILDAVRAPGSGLLNREQESVNGVGDHFANDQAFNNRGPTQSIKQTAHLSNHNNRLTNYLGSSIQGMVPDVLHGPPERLGYDRSTDLFRASLHRSTPQCDVCAGSTHQRCSGVTPASVNRRPVVFNNVEQLATHLHHQHIGNPGL